MSEWYVTRIDGPGNACSAGHGLKYRNGIDRIPRTRGSGLPGIAIRVVLLLVLAAAPAHAADTLGNAPVLAAQSTPMPGYLESRTDPQLHTPFTRVTNPGEPRADGPTCTVAYCTHRYSSSQAWNADQSLLVIVNGCNGLCFLDGRTYRYLFSRTIPNECEWHPIDAALMICVAGSEIYTWAPRTDLRTIVFTDSRYTKLGFGPYKGNPSRDGNRLVVRATDATGQLVAFAYDIAAKVKYPDIALAKLAGANGYCTISPSGNYVYCDQTHWDGSNTAYVFSLEGAIVQHWAENHRPGHGDMTIDADGSDVYVGISKAAPDKYHVIKRRLVDGTVTDLAPYGEAQHASTRNTQLPGWVFLTYAGNPLQGAAHPDQAPFWQEVTALRIDGSGELRRIVQTRNPQHDYWSETHASPSPDGSQVIWSSNWQSLGGPVSDYVARLTRSLNGQARESSHKLRNKL